MSGNQRHALSRPSVSRHRDAHISSFFLSRGKTAYRFTLAKTLVRDGVCGGFLSAIAAKRGRGGGEEGKGGRRRVMGGGGGGY